MQAFEATPPPLNEDADGVLRVAGTRVTLQTIVMAYDMGGTAEEIADRFPSVGLASVYEVIGYVLRHRPAVDAYLATQERLGAEVRADVEKHFSADGIRSRLLARRGRGPDAGP
ncbi:MAG TPA: DUF433 domain-containing protein [Polyangiaceae bacterium]|jgi:uncharacterized protein (DUF433 family)|nr:DUF433 domain-containing protein [Polyangiaceae bacterium]